MRTVRLLVVALILLVGPAFEARAQYPAWRHKGTFFVLTDADGANLPAGVQEAQFPLLVRLHREFFDFTQARPQGEDLRFAAADGTPLAYQIDDWNPAAGEASVWVRVPRIQGNTRQPLQMFWGNPDAAGESNGPAVFNDVNGYLGVWHMTDPSREEVGLFAPANQGTTATPGLIGSARRFAPGQGVRGGESLTVLPQGSEPHSTEAWIRPRQSNGRIVAWGSEKAQGKVVVQLRSPPHIALDCFFSGANVAGTRAIPLAEWVHVAHTYKKGDSRVYVNGRLDAVSTAPGSPLAIPRPAKLWIGGWYNQYSFVGDIDEVRLSKVTRSADWIRLQYENQQPLQTLVGPLVQPGDHLEVMPASLTVPEGQRAEVKAKLGGAQKIYWILQRGEQESILAVDRLTCSVDAGRLVGDQRATLRLKVVTAQGVQTRAIPLTFQEAIPEPTFTLDTPAKWDGRQPIDIRPTLTNRAALQAKSADRLNFQWSIADLATLHEITPEALKLKRAENSGPLTVTLRLDNGGVPTVQSATIQVEEPRKEAWIARPLAEDERPEDRQFFPRDDKNQGTLHYRGTLAQNADAVFVRVFANDQPYKAETQKLPANKRYALAVPLKPGLIKYRSEFGIVLGQKETVLHTAADLVCGDVYLIQGQSNAEATDIGKDDPTFTSEWIRSFGSTTGNPEGSRWRAWGNAVHRDRKGGKLQIGYWGMELAHRLVEGHQMPICILNGAVGGTRIDQHQRNPNDPEDPTTIYGRLLGRVRQAKLTHGVRGILWHQGENDQGADGPTGGFGWETYQAYFVSLAAAWKEDFPNVQHYYVFQIWPRACAMGIDGSDNRLRERQRTLPRLFSNLHLQSTLGIQPPGGCHFPPAGYAEFARLMTPLLERDHYGKTFAQPITPANLRSVKLIDDNKLRLEFDQPMAWHDAVAAHFYLDGAKGQVLAGAVAGNTLTLTLAGPTAAKTLTYLDSRSWSQDHLLRGVNGLAALTFCEVPIRR